MFIIELSFYITYLDITIRVWSHFIIMIYTCTYRSVHLYYSISRSLSFYLFPLALGFLEAKVLAYGTEAARWGSQGWRVKGRHVWELSQEMEAHRGGTVWPFKFYFIVVVWIEGQKRGDWQVALGRADQSHSSREPPSFTHTQKEAPNNGGCYSGDWSRRRPSFVLLIFFSDQEPKLGFKNRPWTLTADHRDTS